MNETFQIRENGFNEIKKQLIIRSIPIIVMAIGFAFVIVYFNSKNKEDLFNALPIIIPTIIFAFGYGIFKGLKRQKSLFATYKLTISENNIVREQTNTPLISIPFGEIQSINKDKKGGYSIKGKTAVETIIIPAQIDNQENLEVVLNQIKPIEQLTQPAFDEKYKIPLLLLTMVSMVTVYISFNKILVGICCVIVSTLLIRSSILILKNKSINNKTKRIGYYSLVVLASVVAVTIMKFNL
jgi:chromate transport protein ChrA